VVDRKPFWVSWYGLTNLAGPWPWEYHGPWWVSGLAPDDDGEYTIPTICAAVMAVDEEAAKRVILDCHDTPPDDLRWRFVEEQKPDWNPLQNDSGRFPAAHWMKWPWPEVDR